MRARDGPLINARSETVREKPAFAASFRLRRCAVPARASLNGGGTKRNSGSGFLTATAPIWALFRGSDTLPRFVILTAEANDSVRPVHARMPVVLPAAAVGDWLADEAAAAAYMRLPMPPLLCERA